VWLKKIFVVNFYPNIYYYDTQHGPRVNSVESQSIEVFANKHQTSLNKPKLAYRNEYTFSIAKFILVIEVRK